MSVLVNELGGVGGECLYEKVCAVFRGGPVCKSAHELVGMCGKFKEDSLTVKAIEQLCD